MSSIDLKKRSSCVLPSAPTGGTVAADSAADCATSSSPSIDEFDPHNLRSWSPFALYGCLGILVLSGTLKTLTTQLATDQAATDTSTLILIWINYFGQWIFGVISKFVRKRYDNNNDINRSNPISDKIVDSKHGDHSSTLTSHTLLILIAALDVIGCIFCLVATVMIGSGLYQVLYASILVMTALLSQWILGYKQNRRQWIFLILVTIGLWSCSFASHTTTSGGSLLTENSVVNEMDECRKYFPIGICQYLSLHVIGIVLTLIGTFIYAIQSVLCELMNSRPSLKVSSGILNGAIGWYGLIMSTVWIVVYTIPNWNELVTRPMSAHQLTLFDVSRVLLLYLLSNVFHRITYWTVVEKTGSIFAGLSNALRTVAVYFLSAWLFCSDTNLKQCATPMKTYAAIGVALAVIMYQLASSSAPTNVATTKKKTN